MKDPRRWSMGQAIDEYLLELGRRKLSSETRRKYRYLLNLFADDNSGVGLDEITRDDVGRFLDKWIDSAEATMALHISCLGKFFGFLVDRGVIDVSPAKDFKRPRLKRPEDLDVVTVSSSDVDRLLNACRTWQEFLCVVVVVYLGVRRRAASRLRRRDLDLDKGTIRVREKGGKVFPKPVPDQLALVLRLAEEEGIWPTGDSYLIPSRRKPRNRERSHKVIYDTVKKIAWRCGVETHVHALRAAFAVQFDEQHPGHVMDLKELLGHSQIETTMVYLRRKDKAKAMETVRDLSWGSVFPPSRHVPPAGFEPAPPPSGVPEALERKLADLKGGIGKRWTWIS